MSIHVSGSVAYDRLMTFAGRFDDHLLPDKLHMINVCFMIDSVEQRRGGTAGNIAYSLALLGETPVLYSTAGKDFGGYDAFLESLGVSLAGLRRDPERLTAGAYITTDQRGNQITGFAPAATVNSCGRDCYPKPRPGDWGLVSPGNMEDMRELPALYRATGTPFVFDPGQQVPALGPDGLLAGLDGAAILIGNAYEMELIRSMTGLSTADLLERADCLITTRGAEGSDILRKGWDAPRHVAVVPVAEAKDPTGAGDCYRAGLLAALHAGLDVETAARFGATSSSFCVEQCGTQEHTFPLADFRARYEAAFGPMPKLPRFG